MPSTSRPVPGAPEFFADLQSKTIDTAAAFAQAHQRVLHELVELSAATAKEGVRLLTGLQTTAVDAARREPVPMVEPREAVDELQQNPLAWYQKAVLAGVDGTQRAFHLMEANAQLMTRSAERLQASNEQSGKHIQEALTSYMTRMKEIYGAS